MCDDGECAQNGIPIVYVLPGVELPLASACCTYAVDGSPEIGGYTVRVVRRSDGRVVAASERATSLASAARFQEWIAYASPAARSVPAPEGASFSPPVGIFPPESSAEPSPGKSPKDRKGNIGS